MLTWLIHTDAGLIVRITAGTAILATLAAADLIRNGRHATHWREHLFLLACVAAAMLYGVANDQITSRISWEYFYYGKDLESVLGPTLPPDPRALHWEAAKIGMKSTWWVGLLCGVVLLLANNPRPGLPRLRNRQLLTFLPSVVTIAIACAAALGIAGYVGWLNWMSTDFQEMARADIFRPRRFISAWGVHLGGYIGGSVGAIAAAARIILRRRTAAIPLQH